MPQTNSRRLGFSTRAIHVGEEVNFRGTGDVVSPIHLSSTYGREIVEEATTGYTYSRNENPTRDALEARLASSENASHATAFSSGIAAVANVLAAFNSRVHVVALEDLYGNTIRLFEEVFKRFNYGFTYVDGRQVDQVERSIRKNTGLIWLESPTNPLLRLCDLKQIVKVARSNGVKTVIDNTFATPYLQNPLDFGVDIVIHSTTKYIGGHSDLIGGAAMTNDNDLAEKLKFLQRAIGAIPSPFDCYLCLRGFKTLAVRMGKHCSNASELANFLEKHPKVDKVYYPGLESHPQHSLAKKQMRGFGGMVSLEVKGGYSATKRFLESLKIFTLAVSLGGVESLAEHPYTMSHKAVSKQMKEKAGIKDTLIRMSVGIEDIADLEVDVRQALNKA